MVLKLKALSFSLLLSLAFQLATTVFANTTEASATPKSSSGKVLVETAKFPARVVTASAGSAIGFTSGAVLGVISLPLTAPLSLIDCDGGICNIDKHQIPLRLAAAPLVFPIGVGLHFAKETAYIDWHAWDGKE